MRSTARNQSFCTASVLRFICRAISSSDSCSQYRSRNTRSYSLGNRPSISSTTAERSARMACRLGDSRPSNSAASRPAVACGSSSKTSRRTSRLHAHVPLLGDLDLVQEDAAQPGQQLAGRIPLEGRDLVLRLDEGLLHDVRGADLGADRGGQLAIGNQQEIIAQARDQRPKILDRSSPRRIKQIALRVLGRIRLRPNDS